MLFLSKATRFHEAFAANVVVTVEDNSESSSFRKLSKTFLFDEPEKLQSPPSPFVIFLTSPAQHSTTYSTSSLAHAGQK